MTAHWTMDSVTGSTLEEEGDNYDGTLVNSPIQSTDRVKGNFSLLLDSGDSERVEVSDAATFTLQANSARTLSFWMKSPNTGLLRFLFQKGQGYYTDGEWHVYHYDDRIGGIFSDI